MQVDWQDLIELATGFSFDGTPRSADRCPRVPRYVAHSVIALRNRQPRLSWLLRNRPKHRQVIHTDNHELPIERLTELAKLDRVPHPTLHAHQPASHVQPRTARLRAKSNQSTETLTHVRRVTLHKWPRASASGQNTRPLVSLAVERMPYIWAPSMFPESREGCHLRSIRSKERRSFDRLHAPPPSVTFLGSVERPRPHAASRSSASQAAR